MSGIAGHVQMRGVEASPAVVERMLAAAAHRGPDGRRVWDGGQAVLGHALLAVSPEEAKGDQPLVRGALAICADARLDNRDELLGQLQLGSRAKDAEVILAAFRRWGESAPQRLLGDFAFAIWDGDQRRLFCARDHFGVKPFYYHAGAGALFFASEIKSLLAAGAVSAQLDEAQVAGFIAGLPLEREATYYREVRRLPPAHTLTISPSGGLRIARYWRLEAEPRAQSDAPEAFRAIFDEAVRCRMRTSSDTGADTVGAMLSGGLDSSSVAGVAAALSDRPLPTFSMVFDRSPDRNERPFVEAVLAGRNMAPHMIDCDNYAPLEGFEQALFEQDGLFFAPGLGLSRRLYASAADNGVRVLLDGHGGDEVVSHGLGRLHELAGARRWASLWREVSGVSGLIGDSAPSLFAAYAGAHPPLRGLARRLRGRAEPKTSNARPADLLVPDLSAAGHIAERLAAQKQRIKDPQRTEFEQHMHVVTHDRQASAFEVLDRAAAGYGTEARYPFWDKRLVEFCVSLPSEEKLSGGWPRLILRRAMADVLPPKVRWRRGKLNFTGHLVAGLTAHHRPMLEQVLISNPGELGRYVDLDAVAGAFGRVTAAGAEADGFDVQTVWRTASLALWLRQTGGVAHRTAAE